MQYSEQPRNELVKASAEIEGMRRAASLDVFEDHWKSYLNRLERIWNKASHHYGKSPKWNGWKGRYEQLRKKDELLSYLINARGADEHTVNAIVSREPGGIGINPTEGNSLFLEEMTIQNGVISIKSPQKLRVDFIPAKTKLIPITNRGRTYPAPTTHLGKPIDATDVIHVAEMGAEFYEKLLTDAESFFVRREK